MPEFDVPEPFHERISRREGAAGLAWLAGLPELARRSLDRWSLTADGPVRHGYAAVVLPVLRADGTPAVLKLSWQDADTAGEPVALSTWNGQGAVLLLAHEPGALLLERLDGVRDLSTEPIGQAVETAAALLAELTVPAPALPRHLRTEAERWVEELPRESRELGHPLPSRLVDAAVGFARERGPEAASLLVNQDLHYQNVLAGTRRPWLVIDPQPLAGDPEFGVIPLLWNRSTETPVADRLRAIVSVAGLDPELTRSWVLFRLVDAFFYSLAADDRWLLDALDPLLDWARRLPANALALG
ncbi:aminoglycoside phosphotransferase family protein [Amycolatopsis sp. YIM 10]|uniref:aminoglycoside phosphotransferase family protein n=1 Tax=Amycolatopsis sp. YIM 10 TaxID=2653857 RepID=UPI0012AAAD45|nr:aminoglycoside phosphotransferase family protein [Amycolatopsis sp. YIM 10]QFU93609.1 Aminoglycoside/hydroxyurea antibiotic resistance kinase [Amycolatopsis sp. YIM 10]